MKKYSEAIHGALVEKMRDDDNVVVLGIGVPDSLGVFGTTKGLQDEFGEARVLDTPICENATVGLMIGASMQGLRPVMVNPRVDFTLLAMDQLINHAAKWKWMFGGAQRVPIVLRMIIGRGWGQGPQHSQSMHAVFAHIPGLKVIVPATPADVKGLLISSIEDDDPVVFLEHRRLYDIEGEVPEGLHRVPIGKAAILHEGTDLTLVASSQMTVEAQQAALALDQVGVSVEVVDLRTLRPLDEDAILKSVGKTGRLIVVDSDWKLCGMAGEILALVAETCPEVLKTRPMRMTWPDVPSPTSEVLEDAYYPSAKKIYLAVLEMMQMPTENAVPESIGNVDLKFTGPF